MYVCMYVQYVYIVLYVQYVCIVCMYVCMHSHFEVYVCMCRIAFGLCIQMLLTSVTICMYVCMC